MSYSNGRGEMGSSVHKWTQDSSPEHDDLIARVSRSMYKLAADINTIKDMVARTGKVEGAAAAELEAELYVDVY